MKVNHLESSLEVNFLSKIKALVALMKLRLSSLVVLSAFFGYFMAKGDLSSWSLCHLLLGGLLITGSSNGFNQLLEINTDLLMSLVVCFEKKYCIPGMSCSIGTPSLTFSVSFSLSPLKIRVSPRLIVTVDLTEVFDLLI